MSALKQAAKPKLLGNLLGRSSSAVRPTYQQSHGQQSNVRKHATAIDTTAANLTQSHLDAVTFAPNLLRPYDGRSLDVVGQKYNSAFYEAVGEIMDLRKRYLEERHVFTKSRNMIPLLRKLGAKEEDFETLQLVSERLVSDPTLPFRKSRNCRFCLDFDTQSVRRLEFQPFALSLEEDFKRHDSGQVRIFDEVENDLQLNTAFQALLAFKAMIIHGVPTQPRPKLDYNVNKWVTTLFNLRTVTKPELLGEPALEGVHTDGVDHTMTTYLGSENMAAESAATMMHDMAETTGSAFGKTSPDLVRARIQHKDFLDTLVIVDHERKHSISPVYAVDKTKEATRDMLIFFTRKPVVGDHISASIDSLTPHKTMPMEFPLFLPPQ